MSQSQNDPAHVKNMTRKSIQISSFIMWPMMIGFGVVAVPFVQLVLTEKWLPCVPFLRIFCFTYGLWPIHTANLQAINAMGRSDLFLKLEIIKKSVGLVALFASMPISPLAMAWSLIIADIIATFVNAYPNIKILNYSYKEQFKDVCTPLFFSVLMGVSIYPIQFLRINDYLILFLQIVLGFVSYIVISLIFKHEILYYILDILKKSRKKGK